MLKEVIHYLRVGPKFYLKFLLLLFLLHGIVLLVGQASVLHVIDSVSTTFHSVYIFPLVIDIIRREKYKNISIFFLLSLKKYLKGHFLLKGVFVNGHSGHFAHSHLEWAK